MPIAPMSAEDLRHWVDAHSSERHQPRSESERTDAPDGAPRERTIKQAMVRAQRLIATRERSSFELLSRLATAGYPDAVCEEVVARCVRASLVDDERFTRVYVSSKQQAGWGRARILRGLRQAGIDPSSYPGTWEESFDDEDELRRALSLLAHHRTSSKDPYRALYAYLMRKGFSSEVSSRAVSLHLKA